MMHHHKVESSLAGGDRLMDVTAITPSPGCPRLLPARVPYLHRPPELIRHL